jgi:sarcosine oxidase subunit gamma
MAPHYYRGGRRGLAAGAPGVTLELITEEDRFNIEARRGKADALLASLRVAFGSAPVEGPRCIKVGDFEFIGIGPSRWHAISRGRGRSERRALLRAAIAGLATGFIVFRLTGPMMGEALSKLIRIDLDPAVFSPGACVTTECHGMTVQLRRLHDGSAYECAVARSFGGSLFHVLARAADPYGLQVEPIIEGSERSPAP